MPETEAYFRHAIALALEQMPEEFRSRLDNVNIFLENFPTQEQVVKFKLREKHVNLLGLYEGVPQNRRGRYGVGGALPDKISLFMQPLMFASRSEEELVKQIKATLYHEIGHHFGMSEEEIRKATKKNS